jgi:hypothetical protein
MHEQHPVFEAPTNADIPIWRYVDLAKFMSMLEDQALHFARADLMWDTFEGSLSEPTLNFEREAILGGMPDENWASWRDQMSRAHQAIRHTAAAMATVSRFDQLTGGLQSALRLLSESASTSQL